ncbi:MAG TPA: type II secretion system protein N [Casimicrobiaceae bacterium]
MTPMPVAVAPGPSRGWRAVAIVATLAAWALLAVVAAYWLSKLVAPAQVHIPPAAADDPASVLLASGLFSRGAPLAPADAPQALPGDARLLGVFAEAKDRGYALFRLSSGPKLVAAGQEIAPGATLARVRPDGIVVREATGERSMALRGAATKSSVSVASQGDKGTVAKTVCAPPSGFKGQVVALNAELMNGLIAQPESWRALLEPSTGALVVRDESGFAAMLGLKRGDRIEQANGIALSTPDDVIGAVLRPLVSNQPVRVTGSRDGQARELWLRNTAC